MLSEIIENKVFTVHEDNFGDEGNFRRTKGVKKVRKRKLLAFGSCSQHIVQPLISGITQADFSFFLLTHSMITVDENFLLELDVGAFC